jgi:hypothetical protein
MKLHKVSINSHLRAVTPEQERQIVQLFDRGTTRVFDIQKKTGVNRKYIDHILLRHRRTQPNALIGCNNGGVKGFVNNQDFVSKVKKLRRSIDPDNGKSYGLVKIASVLGVSYQTVGRVVAINDWMSIDDVLRYVSFRFWDTYRSGIPVYLNRIIPEERKTFISGFVDQLFKQEDERATIKSLLCQRFGITGNSEEVVERIDWSSRVPVGLPCISPKKSDRKRQGEIMTIITRFEEGESLADIAEDYGADALQLANLLRHEKVLS